MRKTVFDGPVNIGSLKSVNGVTIEEFTYRIIGEVDTNLDTENYFFTPEIQELLKKQDVFGVMLKGYNCIITNNNTEVDSFEKNLWLCGIDNIGNTLDRNEDFLVAPCPPYCGNGEIKT